VTNFGHDEKAEKCYQIYENFKTAGGTVGTPTRHDYALLSAAVYMNFQHLTGMRMVWEKCPIWWIEWMVASIKGSQRLWG
jgi:hypothetical protein